MKKFIFALLLCGVTIAHADPPPPVYVYYPDTAHRIKLIGKLVMAGGGVACDSTTNAGFVTCTFVGGGSGTVTSIATGNGLQGGAITTSGTIDLRLNSSGGLIKTLGGGSNELGIDTSIVVTLTGTQVLTNKTLTAPTIVAINSGTSAMTQTTTIASNGARAGFIMNDANATTGDKILSVQAGGVEEGFFAHFGGAFRIEPGATKGSLFLNSPGANAQIGIAQTLIYQCVGATCIDVSSGKMRPESNRVVALGDSSFGFASVTINHIIGSNASVPTCAAGAGAGTGGTCSTLSGSTDTAGTFEVVTGTAPAGSAIVGTVSFNTAFATAPRCSVTGPANAAAAGLVGSVTLYADQASATTAVYVIKDASVTGLTGSTTYDLNYICIQ